MKISVKRKELIHSLAIVNGVIEMRQVMPIIGNILLRVSGERLFCMGTDSTVELLHSVPLAKVDAKADGMQTTVPARKMMDICRSLPDDCVIEMVPSDNFLQIKVGSSHFSLKTLPAEDFPSMPELGEDTMTFLLPAPQLRRALEQTHFAMSKDDMRQYLKGMCIDVRQDNVRFVATDGHRLACDIYDMKSDIQEARQVIVPYKAINQLLTLLQDNTDDITFVIGHKQIKVHNDHFTMISNLIEGKYPDYEQVMVKEGNSVAVITTELFHQAVRRVAILSTEQRLVQLNFSPKTVHIDAKNTEGESATEKIDADYTGSEIKIAFNANYLIDALKAIHTEKMCITLNDGNTRSIFESEKPDEAKSSQWLCVIMPVKV